MESGKTDPLEILSFAQEMEQIENEKRHKKPASMVEAVTEIFYTGFEADEDVSLASAEILETLDDEELGMINAIRFQKEKLPYHRGGSNIQTPSSAHQVQVLQEHAHMQKECQSRLRDKAPEVDTNGKRYASFSNKLVGSSNRNPRIHEVQEIEGHITSYAASAIHAV